MPKIPQTTLTPPQTKTPQIRPLAARVTALSGSSGATYPKKPSSVTRAFRGPKPCVTCKKIFTPNSSNHKYCSAKCRVVNFRRKYPRKPPYTAKKCRKCGAEFVPVNNTQVFCCADCRLSWKKPKTPKVLDSDRYPKGHYVYGWYSNEDKLPFYIGMGTAGRAVFPHILNGEHTRAQKIREGSKSFRAVVYRDRLTKEGALLVEGVLIDMFTWMGALLTNNVRSLTRTETLPLEWEEYTCQ